MNAANLFQIMANVVLSLHVGVVAFVVGGLIFIIVGGLRSWRLARTPWFRLAHLAAICVVVAQAWLDIICPLTTLENWLRAKAHETTYSGGFIEHWLKTILYYEAEPWVFTLVYTLFGLAVIASWVFFPPRRRGRAQALERSQSKRSYIMETLYLAAIPGMRDSIKKGMQTPVAKCAKELKW